MKLNPGIYAFLKSKGVSSYDIIRVLKKDNKEKIGHAGTLDPQASGVLVVAIGKEFTKKLQNEVKKEKEYIAEIYLGKISETFDEEGEKTIIKINKKPKLEDVKKAIFKFIGKIKQTPPIFSAVKIKGKPLYFYARKGIKINPKEREVEIKNIKIIKYKWPILKIKVLCGPGVYIRSLANDLGKYLKTGGYLKNLIRTRVGDFSLKNCIKIKINKNVSKN
jgi:tRNA pseudouridine55 synthase